MEDEISVLIIDQEESCRQNLEKIIAGHSGINIIGSVDCGEKAITLCAQNKPDIVFLDNRLASKDGIDVVNEIRNFNLNPAIVFLSAVNENAVEAFEAAAFDFILKPVNKHVFLSTLNKFKNLRAVNTLIGKIRNLEKFHLKHKKLRFDNRASIMMIDPENILYFEADNCYSDIFLLSGKKETVCISLGIIETMLPPDMFFRISRTHIINLHYLNFIKRKDKKCELAVKDQCILLKITGDRIKILEQKL